MLRWLAHRAFNRLDGINLSLTATLLAYGNVAVAVVSFISLLAASALAEYVAK